MWTYKYQAKLLSQRNALYDFSEIKRNLAENKI